MWIFGGRGFEPRHLHSYKNKTTYMNIHNDYIFLKRVIRNKENKPKHVPSLKRMISLFEKKYPLRMSNELRMLRLCIKQINKTLV
jgi:hypothetical protein